MCVQFNMLLVLRMMFNCCSLSIAGVIKVSFVRKPSGEIQLVASPKTSSEISPLMLERINFDGVSQNVSIAGEFKHLTSLSVASISVCNCFPRKH